MLPARQYTSRPPLSNYHCETQVRVTSGQKLRRLFHLRDICVSELNGRMTQSDRPTPNDPPRFDPPPPGATPVSSGAYGAPPQHGQQPYSWQSYGSGLPGQDPTRVDPVQWASQTPPSWSAPTPKRRSPLRQLFLIVISGLVGMALGTQMTGMARTDILPEPPIVGRETVPTTEPLVPTPAETGGEVTSTLANGVVLISAEQPQGSGAGTGMILRKDGYVLTNYHVVEGSTSLTVTVPNESRVFKAKVLGRDASADVAVLKLENASDLRTVSINEQRPNIGDPVTAIGNARGQGYLSAASGKVVSLSESITVADDFGGSRKLVDMIATTANAVPGDSGGPMFDANGQVIGMTSAGTSIEEQGVQHTTATFAVPIGRALSVTNQIISGVQSGTVQIGPKAYLGITATGDSGGVLVNSAERGKPAHTAGLREGDTIVSLNGQPTNNRTDLADILAGLKPGDSASIKWITSSGQTKSAHVELAASPVN